MSGTIRAGSDMSTPIAVPNWLENQPTRGMITIETEVKAASAKEKTVALWLSAICLCSSLENQFLTPNWSNTCIKKNT